MLAIYTRLSKEDEISNSVDNQLREGREFAKKNNYQDIEIYNEGEGISGGAELIDRPELYRLLQDIISHNITAVWFRNQNRLERSTNTYQAFTYECKKHDVKIFFNDKELNLNDPQNVLWGTVTSAFNQYQKELQSFQTKKSIRDNAKLGKSHGINNYGYTTDKNGYMIIHGEEAEVVKEIFKMSLAGVGTDKISEELNKKDIPTRYSKDYEGSLKVTYQGKVSYKKKSQSKWAGGNIRRIIRNPIYKGERHLKGEIYPAPSIVSDVYWQELQDNLENNKRSSGKSVKHKYLLRGVLRCAKCGKNFYGRTKGENDKYSVYICSSKRRGTCSAKNIKLKVIDDLIWSRFFKDEVLSDLIKQHLQKDDTAPILKRISDELSNLRTELTQNKKEQKIAIDLAVSGVLTKEEIKGKMQGLRIEKSDLDIKIKNLGEEQKQVQNFNSESVNIINDLDNVKTETSFIERKRIINTYLEKIDVEWREELFLISIDFKIPSLDSEVYALIQGYEYALEICNEIIIPLSERFKNFSEEELNQIVYQLYKQLGKTHVEFMKTPCDYDDLYYVWLNTDNWENEFKKYCKKMNIPQGTVLSHSIA